MTPEVTVAIVTYGSAADLPGCFAALAAQEHRGFAVVVVDCASTDRSVEVARGTDLGDVKKTVVPLAENLGFAGGMNEAFRRSDSPYFLTLNADTRPGSGLLGVLLERFRSSAELRLGAVTPRLVRPAAAGKPPRLDACGMVLKTTWRHLDRGSGEVDRGQYMEAERVFGATGAATLWSREALKDVALDCEIFDPGFHSFREDAELCFRLRERGWEVVYEPRAVAEHRRSVLPERRRRQPATLNRNSLRNRYLLRAYHQTGRSFLRTFVPTLARDLGALVYVVLFERTSLPAYAWLWRHRREIGARRRLVQGRRTVAPAEVERWFRLAELPL